MGFARRNFYSCSGFKIGFKDQVQQMIDAGLEVISPGANVPFADKEIFFGPIMEYTDKHLSLLPDFISNCGIARVFAYLMEARVTLPMQDKAIFEDTSNIIKRPCKKRLKKVHQKQKFVQQHLK